MFVFEYGEKGGGGARRANVPDAQSTVVSTRREDVGAIRVRVDRSHWLSRVRALQLIALSIGCKETFPQEMKGH